MMGCDREKNKTKLINRRPTVMIKLEINTSRFRLRAKTTLDSGLEATPRHQECFDITQVKINKGRSS